MTADSDTRSSPPAPARTASRWPWILTAIIVLAGGGAGAAWYMGLLQRPAPDSAVETPKKPIYFTLDDNLVVNFRGPTGARYLQLGIDLMTYDAAAAAALEEHEPVLRNKLILLLSDQSYEELTTREGKEALQHAALAEVQSVLESIGSSATVEALYFTSFVMQ